MSRKPRQILVVDDNQDIRDLVIRVLSSDDYGLFGASDAEKAFEILASNQIDLVLLDVMMPGKSGLEVLKDIRQGSNKKIRKIPIMMITAKSGTDDIDTALALGANSYIVKPFRSDLIREKVKNIFENSSNDLLQRGDIE